MKHSVSLLLIANLLTGCWIVPVEPVLISEIDCPQPGTVQAEAIDVTTQIFEASNYTYAYWLSHFPAYFHWLAHGW